MVNISYNLFVNTARSFMNFYKINRRAFEVIKYGFVEKNGIFLFKKYLFRFEAADKRVLIDETGVEMFINDITIYNYSNLYRTAQLYIVSEFLISKWKEFKPDTPISVFMLKHDDLGQVRFHVRREGQRYYKEDVTQDADAEIGVVHYCP